MLRKQFRVWDKSTKKMLYDGFVLRHGNPPSEDMYKLWNSSNLELGLPPYKRPEYSHCHAEPIETPDKEQLDEIRGTMHDGSADYSLIDWSNFYFENYITMQATGLHDKSGQLIWEYDLLSDGELVHAVEWYYCNFVWNGQQITDFRDFDVYGNEVKYEAQQLAVLHGKQVYTGVMAPGYQGDTFGLETKNLIKVGNLFEDGDKYGFNISSNFLGEKLV